jgi:hypothetical protein
MLELLAWVLLILIIVGIIGAIEYYQPLHWFFGLFDFNRVTGAI